MSTRIKNTLPRRLLLTIEDSFLNDSLEYLEWCTVTDNDNHMNVYLLPSCYQRKFGNRVNGFFENWQRNYIQVDFFAFFRMTYSTFSRLLTLLMRTEEKILSKKFHGGHTPVHPQKALMIFLWYLSKQETLISIGQHFGIVPSTVMEIIDTFLNIFAAQKKMFIFWPNTVEELQIIQNEFANYPGEI
jgi:hypothetical protein